MSTDFVMNLVRIECRKENNIYILWQCEVGFACPINLFFPQTFPRGAEKEGRGFGVSLVRLSPLPPVSQHNPTSSQKFPEVFFSRERLMGKRALPHAPPQIPMRALHARLRLVVPCVLSSLLAYYLPTALHTSDTFGLLLVWLLCLGGCCSVV